MDQLIKLFKKYEELISYVFWGAVAMVVNIAAYYVCYDLSHLSNALSTVIAWAVSVAVAFVSNKLWVFRSVGTTRQQTLRELISFVGFRLLSGAADLMIMIAAVDWMHGDGVLWKIIANIVVIIMNYIFSKFIIFKSDKVEK